MKFILFRKRSLLFSTVLVIMLAFALVAGGINGSGAVWSGKNILSKPICSVETEENNVALSFDVSFGSDDALLILKTLKDYGAAATFFTAGFYAESNSEVMRQIAQSGLVEIGTHGNTHRDMSKLSKLQIKLELETSIKIIEDITETKVTLFRAPYGYYSNTLLGEAKKLNLYTIGHSINSLDYKSLSSLDIVTKVVGEARSGSIILLHCDGLHTKEALPVIIEGLKNKGLKLVTISQLIYKDNYTINLNGKQIRST